MPDSMLFDTPNNILELGGSWKNHQKSSFFGPRAPPLKVPVRQVNSDNSNFFETLLIPQFGSWDFLKVLRDTAYFKTIILDHFGIKKSTLKNPIFQPATKYTASLNKNPLHENENFSLICGGRGYLFSEFVGFWV